MPLRPHATRPARDEREGRSPAPRAGSHRAGRQWTPLARALTVAGDSWTLAIAAELAPGRMRLSALRARLANVSAGLLDRYLQRMASAGLITRSRYREMPPRVEIELTDAGRELLPVAAALSRWALRRAWSSPGPGERVDVEALLRQVPLLLDLRLPLPDAQVELLLCGPERDRRWLLDIRGGVCRAVCGGVAGTSVNPAATIAGDAEAWLRAIGPQAETASLKVGGDRALARALLRALVPRKPARR